MREKRDGYCINGVDCDCTKESHKRCFIPISGITEAEEEKRTNEFLEQEKLLGINMAVMWYMVSAIEYLDSLRPAQVSIIAAEIAVGGGYGYKPGVENIYRVPSLPDKEFTGYQILAWYYVSMKMAFPEILPQIKLPYDKEYDMAQYFKPKKGNNENNK